MANALITRKGSNKLVFEKKFHSAMSGWKGLSYTFDKKYDYAIVTCANSREGDRGWTIGATISNAENVIDCGTTYTCKNKESELSTHTYIVTGITDKTSVSVGQRSDNIALSIVAWGVLTKYLTQLNSIFRKKVLL